LAQGHEIIKFEAQAVEGFCTCCCHRKPK